MGIHPGIPEQPGVEADDRFELGDPGASAHRIHAQQAIGRRVFAGPEKSVVPFALDAKGCSRVERRLGQHHHDVRLHARAGRPGREVHVLQDRLPHFRRTRRHDACNIPVDVAGRLRFEIVGVAKKRQCAHLVCQGGDAFEPPRRVVQRGSGVQRIQSRHGKRGHDADGREPQPGFTGRGPRAVVRHESSGSDQAGQQPAQQRDCNDEGGDVARPVGQGQRVPEPGGIGQCNLDVEHGQRQAGEADLEAVDPAKQQLQCHHPGQCHHAERRRQQDTAGCHEAEHRPGGGLDRPRQRGCCGARDQQAGERPSQP